MTAKEASVRQRKPSEEKKSPVKQAQPTRSSRKPPLFKDDDELIKKAMGKRTHRVWLRSVVIASLMVLVYCISKNGKQVKFALFKEEIILRVQRFACSNTYLEDVSKFPKCIPKNCGRFVSDSLVDANEVNILLEIAKEGFKFGVSSGGASILDLHSGALSYGQQFTNIYKNPNAENFISEKHLLTYKLVKEKIKTAISDRFEISPDSLFLTHPTFFSRITNETAKTVHDEYWHEHVDKETYKSFHYTSLLYLTNFSKDFVGGRFNFIDGNESNRTISFIEPKRGRLSAFTSGEENLHNVEMVTSGERYAITISFTCNPEFAISDPQLGGN